MRSINGLLIPFVLVLSACSSKPESGSILGDRQAAALIADSFQVTAGSKRIQLKKSALGKAFLLIPSLKTAGVAPQWTDFAPILVSFERSDDKIALFELVPTIYQSIKPEQLIGTFPIKTETDSEIHFEFALGLASMPLASNWEDPTESRADRMASHEGRQKGFTVKDSFVRSVSVHGNELSVEQVSRVQTQLIETRKTFEKGKVVERPVLLTQETTYTGHFLIRPYLENPGFRALEPEPEGRIGYFTTRTQKPDSYDSISLTMRWDLRPERGPVRVLLSREIPTEYLPTVKEGFEYWNRALGTNALELVENQEAGHVPPERSILVRWIPWSDAGFAYASLQADPLTGESLRAQIFLTSSFIRLAEGKTPEKPASSAERLGISGLRSPHLCGLSARELPDLFPWIKTTEGRRRAAHDMLRSVVAHEMGHVMGLRHNFAGTFGAPHELSRLKDENRKWIEDPNHPGLAASTTVMDYNGPLSELLVGRAIRSQTLPYDLAALDWGYKGRDPSASANPFCSDEELMIAQIKEIGVLGCDARDDGRNPLIGALEKPKTHLVESFASQASEFLKNAFPKGQPVSAENFEKAMADLSKHGFYGNGGNDDLAKLLHSKNNDVQVASIKTVREAHWKQSYFDFMDPSLHLSPWNGDLISTLGELLSSMPGGLPGSLRSSLGLSEEGQRDASWSSELAARLMESHFAASGKTTEGQDYRLSPDQLGSLKAKLGERLENSWDHWIENLVKSIVPKDGARFIPTLSFEEGERLSALASDLILAVKNVSTSSSSPELRIPVGLSESARLQALEFLNTAKWSHPINPQHRKRIHEELLGRVRKVVTSLEGKPAGSDIEALRQTIQSNFGKLGWEAQQSLLTDLNLVQKTN